MRDTAPFGFHITGATVGFEGFARFGGLPSYLGCSTGAMPCLPERCQDNTVSDTETFM